MSEGLTRLRDVSHAITDELDEHNRLLDDLDGMSLTLMAMFRHWTNERFDKAVGWNKVNCLIFALTVMAIVLFS